MTSVTSSPSPGKAAPQVGSDGQMAGLAVAAGQRVVGDLAQHVLGEPVAAALGRQRVGGDAEHLAAQQLGQPGPHRGLVLAGHRDQRLGGEGGAQHRSVGDQPPHVRVEGIEPGGQQRVQAVRDRQFPDVADQPVHPLDGLHDVPVDQRAHRLHGEQRDALRLGGDRRTGGRWHAGHQRIHQRIHRRPDPAGRGSAWSGCGRRRTRAGSAPARAGRTPARRPAVPGPVDQMVEKVQQARVGVLGILDQQHHRLLCRPAARRTAATRRTAPPAPVPPPCPRRTAPRAAGPAAPPHTPAQPDREQTPPAPRSAWPRQSRPDLPRRCPAAAARSRPAPRTPPPRRRTGTGRGATTPASASPSTYFSNSQPSRDLPTPAGPDTSTMPRHPPLGRGVEQFLDHTQLGIPPGQRRLQPIDPLDTAHPGQHPRRPPQPHRTRLLPFSGAPPPRRTRPRCRPAAASAHPPAPTRLRGRLHPGRGVHRIAGDHPLADRAHRDRHLAGHHPGPRRQPRDSGLGSQLAHRGYQLQPGSHGPLRVPLRGHRRAPHRHHRIADELLHHPAVPADHRPGHVEVAGQQLPDLLRIPGLRQRREPHQIARTAPSTPAARPPARRWPPPTSPPRARAADRPQARQPPPAPLQPAPTRRRGKTACRAPPAHHTTGTPPADSRNPRKTGRPPPGTRRTVRTSPRGHSNLRTGNRLVMKILQPATRRRIG